MILACSTWPLSSSSRPCSVSICSKPSRPNREKAARPRSSATMIQIATPRKGPRFLVLLVLSAISGLVDRALEHAHVGKIAVRSEEHTSELQSRGHLVCRLLLEKKN